MTILISESKNSSSVFVCDAVDILSKLGISENLSLIKSPSREQEKYRLRRFLDLKMILKEDELDSFTKDFDHDQMALFCSGYAVEVSNFSSILNHIGDSTQLHYMNYLGLKCAKDSKQMREVIDHPKFKADIPFSTHYFNLFQSILKHYPDKITELSILKTEENADKIDQIKKNIAIASLSNPSLTEEAEKILKNIAQIRLSEHDKELINFSIGVIDYKITDSLKSKNDAEIIKQFKILHRNIKCYNEANIVSDLNIELSPLVLKAYNALENRAINFEGVANYLRNEQAKMSFVEREDLSLDSTAPVARSDFSSSGVSSSNDGSKASRGLPRLARQSIDKPIEASAELVFAPPGAVSVPSRSVLGGKYRLPSSSSSAKNQPSSSSS